MAIYDLGTASLAANGEVTGVGTTWKAPLTLIRVGATIIFKTNPLKIYTISEIISDTMINVYNPNSETVPASTGYAILAHDGITVQGLAQDVAETLRYYQSRETSIEGLLQFISQDTFDWPRFEQLANQSITGAAEALASQIAAADSAATAVSARDTTTAARDATIEAINSAGDASTLVTLANWGIGSKNNNQIEGFDWQNHVLVSGQILAINTATMINEPVQIKTITSSSSKRAFIQCNDVIGNQCDLTISISTGSESGFSRFSVRWYGAKGSRLFTVREDLLLQRSTDTGIGVGASRIRGLLDVYSKGEVDSKVEVGDASLRSDLNDLNALIESRDYAKYTKAAELAKLLSAGGTFVIDCYGDSTMWGATAGELGTQNTFNPPAVLKTTVTNLYGVSPTVNNLGISGTTIEQMLAGTDGSGSTFASKVSSTSATLIYCNHCINDSQLNNDIHQYRLNLIEFVRLCRLYNKVPVLVTPNTNPAAPKAGIITEEKSKRLRNYVTVMRQVAHDLDVDLVDNFYYYEQTSRMVSPVTLVPDGAHPSTEGYKMSGRNMAIPLVSAHTLRKSWDKAGLSNSTYFDNIASSRMYQTTGAPANRFDGNLSGVRTSSVTGINLAVVLDKPTDDTVLAVYGLQWGSGTVSGLYENGFAGGAEFGGDINQFNSVTTIDWDACYIPPRCKLYAGLHVIGLLTSTGASGASGASGDGFGLSGLGLVPRVENGIGMISADEIRNFNVICTNSEITFDLPLFEMGTRFSLKGCSNDAEVINIDWGGTGTELKIATSRGDAFTIAGSVNSGVYLSRLKFNADKSISVSIGSASITVPAGASPWPNMYVGTMGMRYTVKYLG